MIKNILAEPEGCFWGITPFIPHLSFCKLIKTVRSFDFYLIPFLEMGREMKCHPFLFSDQMTTKLEPTMLPIATGGESSGMDGWRFHKYILSE